MSGLNKGISFTMLLKTFQWSLNRTLHLNPIQNFHVLIQAYDRNIFGFRTLFTLTATPENSRVECH